MPKKVGDTIFLSTEEVAKEFGVTRQTFYANSKRYLRVYRFDSKRNPWYSLEEVKALAMGKPIRKASIAITGMFSDWTEYARSLGFNTESVDRDTKIERLPQELMDTFSITTDKQFLKRSQMSWVDKQPICTWSTWYPIELISDILPQIFDGSAHDIIGYIADRHGIIIREVNDVYSSRITTFEEQSLFQLPYDEPLLILQRMARTEDKKNVVIYQNMELLSSWFVIRRSENIHYWDR